jgi:hypothetical protein
VKIALFPVLYDGARILVFISISTRVSGHHTYTHRGALMRTSIIAQQFCRQCKENREHVLFGRRVEPSETRDTTFVWAQFWACHSCGNHLEKREERHWPIDQDMIVKRLLKVSSDYEQVKASRLEVGPYRVVLTLELHPWDIVETLRRVENSHERGFYRASDLWKLEQYGILKNPLNENHRFPKRPLTKPECRSLAITGTTEQSVR